MSAQGLVRHARVVRVKVLVDVEDETGDAAIGVCDLVERIRRSVRDEGLSRGVVVTGEQDEL